MTEFDPDDDRRPLDESRDILVFVVVFCAGMIAGAVLAGMLCAVARFT